MSPDHPHRDIPGFQAYWQGHQRLPSLQCYMDYIHAQQKAAAIANPGKKRRKLAGLQYSDLYGVPVILVLCEKGKEDSMRIFYFACSVCEGGYVSDISYMMLLLGLRQSLSVPKHPLVVALLFLMIACICRPYGRHLSPDLHLPRPAIAFGRHAQHLCTRVGPIVSVPQCASARV